VRRCSYDVLDLSAAESDARCWAVTSALAAEGDWGQVAQALGKSGSEMPGGIGLPRTDLKVLLDGVELKRRWRSALGSPFDPRGIKHRLRTHTER
jgi:hypothetical protein